MPHGSPRQCHTWCAAAISHHITRMPVLFYDLNPHPLHLRPCQINSHNTPTDPRYSIRCVDQRMGRAELGGRQVRKLNTRRSGGARRDRTADLLHAMQALSQLSYSPTKLRTLRVRGPTVKAARVDCSFSNQIMYLHRNIDPCSRQRVAINCRQQVGTIDP